MKTLQTAAQIWLFCLLTFIACAPQAQCQDNIGRALNKLRTSNALTIGFIGGSITDGTGASTPSGSQDLQCWRGIVTQWFAQHYPSATITSLNAGIGGTGSDLGSFRAFHDVGAADLVFIEFAVNDGGQPASFVIKHVEGIIRRVLINNPNADIVLVTTLYYDRSSPNGWATIYDNGQIPVPVQADMNVATQYGLPCINVGYSLYQAIQNNTISYANAFAGDPHPSRDGYAIYGSTLTAWLNQHSNDAATAPTALPASLSLSSGGGAPVQNGREIPAIGQIGDAGTSGTWTSNQVGSGSAPLPIAGSNTTITRVANYESYAQTSTAGAVMHYQFSGSSEIGVVFGQSNNGGKIDVSVDDPTFTHPALRRDGSVLTGYNANVVGFIAQDYVLIESLSAGTHNLYIRCETGTNQIYTILIDPTTTAPTGTVYEAENGYLEHGATVNTDSAASGGHTVGYMQNPGAADTISGVSGGSGGGSYTLAIRYANGNYSASTLHVFVNGVRVGLNNGQLSFPSTGAWTNAYSTVSATVILNAGATNNISIQNNTGDTNGIDVDYFLLTPHSGTVYEAESGYLEHGASAYSDVAASGSHGVSGMQNPGAADTISGINGGNGGTYNLTIRYANNGATATKHVFINGNELNAISLPGTGTGYGLVSVPVTLNAGSNNTLSFQNYSDTGAANIDYFQFTP